MALELKDIEAILGFIRAFVGGRLSSRAQSQQDYKKWVRARQDDARRDIRLAVADVEKLAAFAHSMMWVTYKIRDREIEQDIMDTHNKEGHELISSIVRSQIRLAALDIKSISEGGPFNQ
jgi:hypothetical protein